MTDATATADTTDFETARHACLRIIADITEMESNGRHAKPEWHTAQRGLGKALTDFRKAGATNSDTMNLWA